MVTKTRLCTPTVATAGPAVSTFKEGLLRELNERVRVKFHSGPTSFSISGATGNFNEPSACSDTTRGSDCAPYQHPRITVPAWFVQMTVSCSPPPSQLYTIWRSFCASWKPSLA